MALFADKGNDSINANHDYDYLFVFVELLERIINILKELFSGIGGGKDDTTTTTTAE